MKTGPCFNIKTLFPSMVFHEKDKTVVSLSNRFDKIIYTVKTTSLYWDGSLYNVALSFLLWLY